MSKVRNQLLRLLLEKKSDYLSGEEISRLLGISRAAIWKQIEELRKEGYQIEAKQRSGYRLVYRPDRVAPEEIYPHLQTRHFGKTIRFSFSTPSTQILAHEWAREGAEEGAVVIAEEQTAGKGRLGRSWHSPPGTGIWMSLVLRPSIPIQAASHLTLLASLGVKEGIEAQVPVPITIKWPNDLLIRGKKVCGILTEMRGDLDAIDYVILGIGINVNLSKEIFPEELQKKATSLMIEAGKHIHRASLVASILKCLEDRYQQYLAEGFAPIREKWEQASQLVGKTITAHTFQGSVNGVVLGMNEHGALLIQTENGVVPIYSADLDLAASV